MILRGLGGVGALRGRVWLLGLMVACVMTSCATRKPGREYLWVPVYEATSCDAMTETYIGIGRTL
jgi:hypothetical protein